MKKLIVIACLVTMVMGLAGAAGAYVIQGTSTVTPGTTWLISTAADNVASPVTNPAGNQTWFALPGDNNWSGTGADGGLFYRKFQKTTAPAKWTLMAFVDDATASPTMTVKIYGSSATNIADIVGQTWALWNKETGAELARGIWASTSLAASPLITYTFANTAGMVGQENALALSLGAVPEPGSMVAMLSGLVGLAGFGIRRRK